MIQAFAAFGSVTNLLAPLTPQPPGQAPWSASLGPSPLRNGHGTPRSTASERRTSHQQWPSRSRKKSCARTAAHAAACFPSPSFVRSGGCRAREVVHKRGEPQDGGAEAERLGAVLRFEFCVVEAHAQGTGSVQGHGCEHLTREEGRGGLSDGRSRTGVDARDCEMLAVRPSAGCVRRHIFRVPAATGGMGRRRGAPRGPPSRRRRRRACRRASPARTWRWACCRGRPPQST